MFDIHYEDLTDSFRRVADVIGIGATAKLINVFGGRKVYVPTRPTEGSVLARVIGVDATRRLSDTWGRHQLQVPLLDAARIRRRDAELRQRRAAGASVSTLSQDFGLTERRVFAICASVEVALSQ